MEGWVGEDFVRLGWQVDLEKIFFDDADVFDLVFLEILAEFLGGAVVGFDGPNFTDALSQSNCNDTRTSADIEDEVALFEVAVADKLERKAG